MARLALKQLLGATLYVLSASCVSAPTEEGALRWQLVAEGQREAFFSIAGSSSRDVWLVGADRGNGPVVQRYDGTRWVRQDTGHRGDLFWVHAFADGTALLAGSGGAVLRFDGSRFHRLTSPGTGRETVFGVWGTSTDDAWFAGATDGFAGFAWHLLAGTFTVAPLPLGLPRRTDGSLPALLKVFGDPQGTVWLVGDSGTLLRSERSGPLQRVHLPARDRLFTVHGSGTEIIAVGGTGQGQIYESRRSFVQSAPEATPPLQGVYVGADQAWAVGQFGTVLERRDEGWRMVDTRLNFTAESLHAVWIDPEGGVWAAGGNVLSTRLDAGVLMYYGRAAPQAL